MKEALKTMGEFTAFMVKSIVLLTAVALLACGIVGGNAVVNASVPDSHAVDVWCLPGTHKLQKLYNRAFAPVTIKRMGPVRIATCTFENGNTQRAIAFGASWLIIDGTTAVPERTRTTTATHILDQSRPAPVDQSDLSPAERETVVARR